MPKSACPEGEARQGWRDEEDGCSELPFKPLTRNEAEAVVAKLKPLSLWRILVIQALAAAAVVVLAGLLAVNVSAVWSAIYGSAVVLIPAAWMAGRIRRQQKHGKPSELAVRFMLWEFGKILLSVALLALAPKVVRDLSWPWLVGSLVVCLKASWLALLIRR